MTDPTVRTTPYPQLSQANKLVDEGEYDRAAQMLIAHLRQYPNEPRGLASLGNVANRLGALGQAEHFLRRAIAAGQHGLEVRRNLASVLNQQDRLDLAEQLIAALVAESGDQALRCTHANVLDRLGRHDEALAMQQSIVADDPQSIFPWIALGHMLRAAGRVDEAVDAYRRATQLDEEFGESWWGLASIKRKIFTDEDLAVMRRALAIAIDIRNTAPLHFAIARALHDRGEFEQAFYHYSEGNGLRAESLRYNARELTDEVAETERAVDASFMARLGDTPAGDATPVFIVCLPRSGSTLLEQMLGSHPSIEPAGELAYIPAILRSLMEMATRRGKVTVPQAIAALSDEQAAALGRDYLHRASLHRKTDRPFFIDKLPNNWSNILFIRRILPQARFIDIRRPAMDCCFSNFTLSFTSAHASSFALKDVGQCYVDYVRLMKHFDRVAPGLIHHLSYGALIEDQEAQLRPALEYLGLPWDDALLNFHKLDRVVRTPSSEQVRRPINRDGIDVWKPYAQWLDPLREVLGDLAEG